MTPKARLVFTIIGLFLNAIGAVCLAIAGHGCAPATPSGYVAVNGCLGDCPSTTTAPKEASNAIQQQVQRQLPQQDNSGQAPPH